MAHNQYQIHILTLIKETEFLMDVCKMGHGKTKREVVDIVRRTVKKKKEKEGKELIYSNI